MVLLLFEGSVVFIHLLAEYKQVYNPADTEQTGGENVQNTHSGFSEIEFVDSNQAKKEPQKVGGSFAFHNSKKWLKINSHVTIIHCT